MSRFDKEAKNWDKSSRRFQVATSFANFVKKNANINKETKLLDYGCGTGLVAYQFEDLVGSIVGMDSSEKMLEEFLSKKKSENIKAIKHDISKERLPIDSFDLIVSSMTIHHIKDVNIFFKEAKKALRKDGYLAIGDLDKEDGTFHDKGNEGVCHFGFEKESIVDFFENNGFELIDFDYVFKIDKNNREYKIFAAIGRVL